MTLPCGALGHRCCCCHLYPCPCPYPCLIVDMTVLPSQVEGQFGVHVQTTLLVAIAVVEVV